MIADIAELLNWTSDVEVLNRLRGTYLDTVGSTIGSVLSKIGVNTSSGAALRSQLNELSNESFVRLVTAPQIYYELSFGSPDPERAGIFLSNAIAAEQYRTCINYRAERSVWTALGDYYFPKGEHYDLDPPNSNENKWQPDKIYVSPKVGTITVDYVSPYAIGELPDVKYDSDGIDETELDKILTVASRALEGIEQVSAVASDIIKGFTKTLVLRKDLRSRGFHSCSTRLCIGRPVMINSQLPSVGTSKFADALIHETIHAILDTNELEEKLTNNDPAAARIFVCSPWSGKNLGLNTYIQACFVWFGLWKFWLLAILKDGAFEPEDARTHLQMAASGFVRTDPYDLIKDFRLMIHPSLPDILRQLRKEVVSMLDGCRLSLESTVT